MTAAPMGTAAGIVVTFDEAVGLGTVRTGDGSQLRFHCTQIADGSRTIDPGTPVVFDVIAGRHGCWEAGHLRAGGPRS
ncbi:MAG: cold shock domain-containing protein [Acidimicrobiales bacterium]